LASAPVDIPIQIKGLSDLQKMERRMEALEKEITRVQKITPKAANSVVKFGRGAKGAVAGVRALGTSVKAALGPIGLALSAVGGLTAAFNTLKGQDFSQAKFESLGGDSQQLVTNLKAVSNELQGTASVAELTGAAYDVASAGFSSAAEASLVLKAASLGATGGFSDINTVANATTSVLNAYGKSAADAGKLVDQFIQTQNDGKIVVGQYADNIGKVASAAAGLGVPLSEINAVIAQSTAAGVNAEVAFTGLKGALARLASGQASKELEQFGIEIDAASIETDGLLGTLKKLEGLDTGTLFKALGTEAGPALLPVIQNLERYEELVRNQENANGTAAAAAATAAGTIEGAWKRVTVALENIFSDQTELGQVIRGVLLAAAATVELLGAAFTLLVSPIRAVIEAVMAVASAWTGVKDGEAVLQSLTALWFEALAAVNDFSNTVVAVGKVIGDYIATVVNQVQGWFAGLWASISSGVQGVIQPIVGAFTSAFNTAKSIIEGFWNSLPGWLKGALNAAGSVAGGVVSAVSSALNNVVKDIQAAKAQVEITVPEGPKTEQLGLPTIPTGGAAAGGGGGGGGGGGAADKAAKDAEKLAQKTAEQVANAEKLITAAQREGELLNANSEFEKAQIESKNKIFEIAEKYGELAAKSLSDEETRLLVLAQGEEVQNERLKLAEKEAKAIKSATQPLLDQQQFLQEAITLGREEATIRQQIRQAMEGLPETERQRVESLVRGNKALEDQLSTMDQMKDLAGGISDTLENGLVNALGTAVEGLITGAEDLDEQLKKILQGVLKDIANQMIKAGISSLFQSIGGGGAGGIFGGLFRAEGGPVAGGQSYIVGEKGPEIFTPGLTGNITSNQDSRAALSNYSGGNASAAGAMAPMAANVTYSGPTLNFNGDDYIPRSEAPALVAAGAKQGQARAMSTLKNSRSQRQKLGM
jgi:TP901 family phage tail tape measure protein